MTTEEKGKLIGQVLDTRQQRQTKQSEARKKAKEARMQLPQFRDRLSGLFQAHFQPLESDISDEEMARRGTGKTPEENEALGHEILRRMFNTSQAVEFRAVLESAVTVGQGKPVVVKMEASEYPTFGKPMDHHRYRIEVEGLDQLLAVNVMDAKIESKQRRSNAPTDMDDIVVGARYHSWPVSSREAYLVDFQEYNELLDSVEKGPTKFKAYTLEVRQFGRME